MGLVLGFISVMPDRNSIGDVSIRVICVRVRIALVGFML